LHFLRRFYSVSVSICALVSLFSCQISNNLQVTNEVPPPVLPIWIFGDAHVHTEIRNGYLSLESAIKDSLIGGDEGGESFEWDIALNTGDYKGAQDCPKAASAQTIVAQFENSGVDRNRIYSVIGNHDSNEHGASWFRRYIDPLGNNSNYSGVNNHLRPYKTSGNWDHYKFKVGNILFLLLGDNNFGGPPFGRDCEGGAPAGRYTKETFDWWVDQVESNQEMIIVTVAHHALYNTTIFTGFDEAAELGIHGGKTWADQKGSSMIYAIGDWTIDGYNQDHEFIGDRPFGFKKFLKENPGAIDFWIHGHTHYTVHPGKSANEKSDIERVHGVWFINAGAIAKYHGRPDVPFSRLLTFTEGNAVANLKTYLHTGTWNGQAEGFYEEVERNLEVSKPYTTIIQQP